MALLSPVIYGRPLCSPRAKDLGIDNSFWRQSFGDSSFSLGYSVFGLVGNQKGGCTVYVTQQTVVFKLTSVKKNILSLLKIEANGESESMKGQFTAKTGQ